MAALVWLYLAAVLLNAGNLFLQVFFSVMYSDLESDYINPVDLCNKVNKFLIPEAALQAFVTFLMLISGQWLALILNLPLVAYNVNKFVKNQIRLDATEIFRTVHRYKTESFVKLVCHLLLFFYYLYSMIIAIVVSDESREMSKF
uniref:ARAD1D40128p n=1 Tax=Blastobotrys adeninivorans TaxID=409370 RepID=A0A060TIR6_BLAAD